ncbi:hypothetical protein D9M71_820040 [compost metagenome]
MVAGLHDRIPHRSTLNWKKHLAFAALSGSPATTVLVSPSITPLQAKVSSSTSLLLTLGTQLTVIR